MIVVRTDAERQRGVSKLLTLLVTQVTLSTKMANQPIEKASTQQQQKPLTLFTKKSRGNKNVAI
jgi:hypothetical protein